jgi:hypothetical protein
MVENIFLSSEERTFSTTPLRLFFSKAGVLFSFKGLQCRLLFVYFTHNIAAGAHDMALY